MNQQSQPTPSYPIERGDELDLIGLWKVLFKYKILIISFTVITTLSSAYYVSTLPDIYKSEALVVPIINSPATSSISSLSGLTGVSLSGSGIGVMYEQAFVRLKTKEFLVEYIKYKKLKPILFPNIWNGIENEWIAPEPTDTEAFEFLNGMLHASSHERSPANLMSIYLEWEDPVNLDKISEIVNSLIVNINNFEKKEAIKEAEKSIEFLNAEISKTSILESKILLYRLVEQQLIKIMEAKVRDEFLFKVIDSAVVPTKPKRKPIFIFIFIGMVIGLLVSSFVATIFEKFNTKK
jgi:hypothetical protein